MTNTALHGPGYFQEVLARHGIPFCSHRVTSADPVPAGGEFAALAIFGGPFDIHDADLIYGRGLEPLEGGRKPGGGK